ncbi:uncharacterized protein BDR25DRAFT_343541 [Lindgomyces ingoldianus]|uniref:Uncharacterized protein n=1 Tax=Lindgomyces ingoldianus TaxID=673940 RepID=A0ACB6QUL1_9PLEO|nr:uncharacterized protein BDR25DRAFT_343541 [Lindgomyces ingoldianus]KAF2469881.1 hypothetical protein BDR25DRAFT_343541 [Lindgomyces ingoldianus]
MEDPIQEPYQDSPSSSRAPSSTPSASSSPWKPLPSIPSPAPASQEPYHDEPSASPEAGHTTPSRTPRYRAAADAANSPPYFPPYSDIVPDSDDDVPLAYLYPLPTEAPPSYHVAVQQSYRATLISHIPSDLNISDIVDEEADIERVQVDDVRFGVERVLAKLIVAMILLLITLIFVWYIFIVRSLPFCCGS